MSAIVQAGQVTHVSFLPGEAERTAMMLAWLWGARSPYLLNWNVPGPKLNWNVPGPKHHGPFFLGEMRQAPPVGQRHMSTRLGPPHSTAATLPQNGTSPAAEHPPAFPEPSYLGM